MGSRRGSAARRGSGAGGVPLGRRVRVAAWSVSARAAKPVARPERDATARPQAPAPTRPPERDAGYEGGPPAPAPRRRATDRSSAASRSSQRAPTSAIHEIASPMGAGVGR
jgi:hypothetical protein